MTCRLRLTYSAAPLWPSAPTPCGWPTSPRYCCGNRPGWGSLDGLGRLWDEHDVIAQIAQALDQPGGGALARDLIKVALAEVTEGLAGGEHVEGSDEQLVSNGHESPHGPAAATQAVILVTIVAAFGPHRSRGSGEQHRLQEHVAPAHGRSLRLAGALVIAGCDTSPGRQAASRGEHAHVGADLSQDGGRGRPVHARDLHQEPMLGAKRLELRFDVGVERCDVVVDRLQGAQLHREQKALMLAQVPLQRGLERGLLTPHPTPRETGDRGSISHACRKGLEHG